MLLVFDYMWDPRVSFLMKSSMNEDNQDGLHVSSAFTMSIFTSFHEAGVVLPKTQSNIILWQSHTTFVSVCRDSKKISKTHCAILHFFKKPTRI